MIISANAVFYTVVAKRRRKLIKRVIESLSNKKGCAKIIALMSEKKIARLRELCLELAK